MAQGKIVFDRIVGIELAQGGRDLFGGGPAGGSPDGQSQITADPMNVGVYGNDQLGGGDRPQAEIDPVCGSHHPAGVKNETLASAAGARITH